MYPLAHDLETLATAAVPRFAQPHALALLGGGTVARPRCWPRVGYP